MTGQNNLSKAEQQRFTERKEKIQKIVELGYEPFPYTYTTTHSANDILQKYTQLEPEEKTTDEVSIMGRLMTFRKMGKAAFAHIQDQSGKVQVYFRSQDLEKQYEIVSLLDLGDIIGIKGYIFKTRLGEITIYVQSVTLLTKSLHDLPDKFHGLKDVDLRFRNRHLDFIMNTDVRETLRKRSIITREIRHYFEKEGFLEVETPILQTQYGGANATPFKTHINAWDMPMYLSISPELYLKRLIIGGFEQIFTICRNFRNEGVDHSHNPEFTMLEAYRIGYDYEYMMTLIENLFAHVAKTVNGTTKVQVTIRGKEKNTTQEIDLAPPWRRKTLAESIKDVLGIDVLAMSQSEVRAYCVEKKLDVAQDATWGTCVMEIFDEFVEHTIIEPTHIYDRPVESTPLCKPKRGDPRLVEQCEPIIAGMEVGNIYSELNDAILQRKLLEDQAAQLRGGDDEAHPMDEDFVKTLEYGMPPTAGIGIGIDRMVMIITGSSALREVILFPTVKPEETANVSKNQQ